MFIVKKQYNRIVRKRWVSPQVVQPEPIVNDITPKDVVSEFVVETKVVAPAEKETVPVVEESHNTDGSQESSAVVVEEAKPHKKAAKKKKKKQPDMDKKQLNEVEQILLTSSPNTKKDKKHGELYEVTSGEPVILTEDNKMILND